MPIVPAQTRQDKRDRERKIEAILGPEIYALTIGESPSDEFDENGFVVAKPKPSPPSRSQQWIEDMRLLDEQAEEALADLQQYLAYRETWSKRGLKAMMLAPTLDICRALLRDERVPWNVLSYFQCERYGLRRRQPDGRYGVDDFNDVRRPADT